MTRLHAPLRSLGTRAAQGSKAVALASVLLFALSPVSAQQLPIDRLEGKWRGMAGTPLDRIEIALEFKRDTTGGMAAYLYQPVGNYYGLQLPGVVESDSGKYQLRAWRLELTPRGDTLDGTLFFNRVPIALTRTRVLPSEVPVPKLPAGPGPDWQLKLGAAVYAVSAMRDGVAYVGTSGGMFHAVNASTGAFIWSFAAGRPIHGGAAVTDSAVFFVCDNGYLFKLRRKDGVEVWRYDLGDSRTPRILLHQVIDNSGDFDFDLSSPTPVLSHDTLYVGSGDGSMHAVNAETGQRIWRFEGRGKVRATAAMDGDRLVFGTFDGFVYALDRVTGMKKWELETRGPIVTPVTPIGDRIIVGNRFGLLAAIEAATGKAAWRAQLWGSSAESEATPAGGSLFYFGSSDLRRVALMDALDGRVLWRTDVFGLAWPKAVVHNKHLLVSTIGARPYQMRHLGALTAIDRSSGKIVWRWAMPELPGVWAWGFFAPPAIEGDRLVIGGLDGTLYGFKLSGS